MNLDGIKVNHAALDNAVQDMRGMVNKMDRRLNDLERELQPLKSSWAGKQQVSYLEAKATWDKAIDEMKQLLTEAHIAVTQSNDDYRGADRAGAALFGG